MGKVVISEDYGPVGPDTQVTLTMLGLDYESSGEDGPPNDGTPNAGANDGNSNAGASTVAPFHSLPPFSQPRTDKAKEELKKAIAEVDELNPPREGHITLGNIGRWADRNIIQGARERLRGGPALREVWLDPENLRNARDGPGTDINDRVYRKLMRPRLVPNTEEPKTRDPLGFTANNEDMDMDPDENWRRKMTGTPEYHGQWTAYQASPPLYPQIKEGKLSLVSSSHENRYERQPIPLKVENPPDYQQYDFVPKWEFWPIYHWNPQGHRQQFFKWLNTVPDPGLPVDIYHAAFFDGTACPDGGSSMMIMKQKHIMIPRNDGDGETRLHWHETSAGYVWNIRCHLKAKIRAEILETKRQIAIRGTLGRSNKRTHPNLFLRPGEFTDVENLVPLFNWYAEKTAFLPDTTPINKVGINKIIQTCRDRNLPFIVAVPDKSTRIIEKRSNDPEIIGFAYLKRFNDERSTAELRVFVDPECKKLQIGTCLTDMILRTCDIGRGDNEVHQFYEFIGREKLAYGDKYPCHLNRIVCVIAYEPQKEKEYSWVKDWLVNQFHFKHEGHIPDGRMKFCHRYVYLFCPIFPHYFEADNQYLV